MDNANLPAPVATGALARLQEAVDAGMAPALAIMLDDVLFNQVTKIATVMSKAVGFVPAHCVNKTEVCFAITTRSLVWRLDPFAVAQSTYQPVEGAKVSYEAKLVQAILEQSGRLDGPITREYRGEWSKVQGKFRMQTSEKSGKKYAVASWPEEAETGLGITVSALLKGERERRSVPLDLRQCHPRNSTLWATDPQTQIYYRAVRMLGNVAMPGVLMGVPFLGEVEEDEDSRARRARNVTPIDTSARASAPPEELVIIDPDGEEIALLAGEVEAKLAEWCRECSDEALAQLADNNPEVAAVRDAVEAEELRRASKAAQPGLPLGPPDFIERERPSRDGSDSDPLKILGLSAKSAIDALEVRIHQADAAEADRLLAVYRAKLEKASPNAYKTLEAMVAAKIEGRE